MPYRYSPEFRRKVDLLAAGRSVASLESLGGPVAGSVNQIVPTTTEGPYPRGSNCTAAKGGSSLAIINGFGQLLEKHDQILRAHRFCRRNVAG